MKKKVYVVLRHWYEHYESGDAGVVSVHRSRKKAIAKVMELLPEGARGQTPNGDSWEVSRDATDSVYLSVNETEME